MLYYSLPSWGQLLIFTRVKALARRIEHTITTKTILQNECTSQCWVGGSTVYHSPQSMHSVQQYWVQLWVGDGWWNLFASHKYTIQKFWQQKQQRVLTSNKLPSLEDVGDSCHTFIQSLATGSQRSEIWKPIVIVLFKNCFPWICFLTIAIQ